MGMHYGLVAVPATVEALVREFAAIWPHYRIKDRAELSSLDGWFDWKRQNERFVAATDWTPDNAGVEVLGFLQDGEWAVLLDTSYALASDSEALVQLSASFDRCLSFVVETVGGCASFTACRQGRLERSIESVDGEVRTEGGPLPEEAGLDIGSYYVDETEALQQRFGLRAFTCAPPVSVLAIAAVDQTDYSEQLRQAAPVRSEKPWWKLW